MSAPAASVLNLHAGGHEVDPDTLARIDAPPPTRTWFPVRSLEDAGYRVASRQLAVSHAGQRFFGSHDLMTDFVASTSRSRFSPT